MKGQRVLFLCTGNYYRSRFAEELFNHLCIQRGLPHRADSRALAIELGRWNVGPLSAHTRQALADRQIKPLNGERMPQSSADADFESADLVIAVKELEHRPLMERRHPKHAARVQYWHVHDLDAGTPDQAMTQLEQLVTELVGRLAQ